MEADHVPPMRASLDTATLAASSPQIQRVISRASVKARNTRSGSAGNVRVMRTWVPSGWSICTGTPFVDVVVDVVVDVASEGVERSRPAGAMGGEPAGSGIESSGGQVNQVAAALAAADDQAGVLEDSQVTRDRRWRKVEPGDDAGNGNLAVDQCGDDVAAHLIGERREELVDVERLWMGLNYIVNNNSESQVSDDACRRWFPRVGNSRLGRGIRG